MDEIDMEIAARVEYLKDRWVNHAPETPDESCLAFDGIADSFFRSALTCNASRRLARIIEDECGITMVSPFPDTAVAEWNDHIAQSYEDVVLLCKKAMS